MLPETSPTNAPVRVRSVGAIWRTAQISTAKGATAMIGIDKRHSSQSLPVTMWSQCETGANARCTSETSMMTANGRTASPIEVFRSPPGRESRSR